MKKNIALLFVFLVIFSLGACDEGETNYSPSQSSSASPALTTSTASSKSSTENTSSSTDNSNKESLTTESSKSESSKSIDTSSQTSDIPKTDINFDSSYAFLGNSIIGDLEAYKVVDDADVYSYVGLNVSSVFDQKLDGHKKSILDEMLSKNYKTIFIMLGTNELGWSYSDIFVDDYSELIDTIKEALPDCKINLISITPITKSQEDLKEDGLNKKRIDEYNQKIKALAAEKKIGYLDVNKYLVDENGYLPENDSPDGCHLQPNISLKFVDAVKYLITK